jgi:hypothetical protein
MASGHWVLFCTPADTIDGQRYLMKITIVTVPHFIRALLDRCRFNKKRKYDIAWERKEALFKFDFGYMFRE